MRTRSPSNAAPPGPEVDGTSAGSALIVDDHDLVRSAIADMLASFGYRVVEAASGEAAAALLADGLAVDLLVTDRLMPGMNGIELARLATALCPGLRVLIVSGSTENLPPDLPCLSKPFGRARLQSCLAEILPGAAASRPASEPPIQRPVPE